MVKKPLIRPLFLGGRILEGGLVDQPLELVFVSGFFLQIVRTIPKDPDMS